MQVCTLLQTDNHASTPPLSFLQAGCPSYRPTNSVNTLKANKLAEQTLEGNLPCLVAEWLACWAQAQNGMGSNHSRKAVG